MGLLLTQNTETGSELVIIQSMEIMCDIQVTHLPDVPFIQLSLLFKETVSCLTLKEGRHALYCYFLFKKIATYLTSKRRDDDRRKVWCFNAIPCLLVVLIPESDPFNICYIFKIFSSINFASVAFTCLCREYVRGTQIAFAEKH
jgi:hypothetical protein